MEKKRLFAGIASLVIGLSIMGFFAVVAPVGGWAILDWDPMPQAIAWILLILSSILIMIGLIVVIQESEKMGYI